MWMDVTRKWLWKTTRNFVKIYENASVSVTREVFASEFQPIDQLVPPSFPLDSFPLDPSTSTLLGRRGVAVFPSV
jgi:hypothetical protein